MKSLNHDLLERAKLQHFLGLDITGDYLDLQVKVIKGVTTLLYGKKVLNQAVDIYSCEGLVRDYRMFTGKRISNREYNRWFKPYDGNFEESADKKPAEFRLARKKFFEILDILESKGIDYELED